MPTPADPTTYPIPVFSYLVNIGDDSSIAFSEVSGLSIEYETITYKDGLSAQNGAIHMLGMGTPVNLTLQKGIIQDDNKLYDWIYNKRSEKKTITIFLCDAGGDPKVKWTVTGAFPTKLNAPTFSATSNEVAIESLELMADNLTLEYL